VNDARCPKCGPTYHQHVVARKPAMRMGTSSTRMGMSSHARRTGHPLVALGVAALGGVSALVNKFYVEVEYECRGCRTKWSRFERET